MTIDSKAWGFRRDAPLGDFLSSKQLIDTFIETVSCGGNMLMNVGPTKEGTINPIFQERLLDIGAWKLVNNEGIRGSRPWIYQNDTLTSNVWYTMQPMSVYAFVLDWPVGSTLSLGAPVTTSSTSVELLGYPGTFSWKPRMSRGIDITIPPIPFNKMPCKFAWTFKFTNLGY
ncbi:hypothetical protein SNE40_014493 [Patella caerulea]